MKNLQLTNIKNKIDYKNIFYLGEWCLKNSEIELKKKSIIPYHWNSLKKIEKDHKYVKNLHQKISKVLVKSLNKIHKKNYSDKSWGVIFEPFLQYYITVLLDRWEITRKAFLKKGKYQVNFHSIKNINFEMHDYEKLLHTDEWNQNLFQNIINFQYKKKARITKGKKIIFKNEPDSKINKTFFNIFIHTIKKYIDTLLAKVNQGNHFFFVSHYFDTKNFIKLNLLLKQIPVFHDYFIGIEDIKMFNDKKNQKLRNQLFKNIKTKNNFEKFLVYSLKSDITSNIIENFNLTLNEALKIKQKPKVILSAGLHWNHILFKSWLAEKINNGTKFLSIEHGGSFPFKYPYFFFEENNTTKSITWFKEYHQNQKQLPAQKLLKYKKLANYNYKPKKCYLILDRIMRYSLSLATPVSSNYLIYINDICNLYKTLNLEVKNEFNIKLHPADEDKVWNTKKFLEHKLKAQIAPNNKNIIDVILESKLTICFYPETTFSECMRIGVPCVLYVSPKIHQINPISKKLFNHLIKVGIIFDDVNLMALHVNKIWIDPQKWWNSSKIVIARNFFEKEALCLDEKNSLLKWYKFLKTFK